MAKGYHAFKNEFDNISNWKVAIVWARFNHKITSELKDGALRSLKKAGLQDSQVTIVDVPGAVEIPVVAKTILKHLEVDAVITLGTVIRGETTHYDYVCNSVERGCSQLALEFCKPVVFGVLTTENEAQALDRIGGAHGHKGEEAGEVALEMIQKLRTIINAQ